ncbi:S-layer homology domain-containing protein [Bacilliculturomica massiliensis]|uniref:S-layer homology domain-containing protein n=1 Tax=Bacilliculturomica massiliensis TaxID=1917867 RepID=UPI00102FC26E|nr:S-layer homology domain-containing protein [Bacilliculturomica massiliensis]
MKKLCSWILTFAMLLSLLGVPVYADEPQVILTITPDVTEVKANVETEITYTVAVKIADESTKVAMVQYFLAPPAGMTLAEEWDANLEGFSYCEADLKYDKKTNPNGIFETVFEYTPASKYFLGVGGTETRNLHYDAELFKIKAKINSATPGSIVLGVDPNEITKFGGHTGNADDVFTYAVETTPVMIYSEIAGEQAVNITAPVKGAEPQTSVSGSGYEGTISWSGNPASFAGDTAYTASVTLTAGDGYRFTSDATVTVEGAEAVKDIKVASNGASLSFTAAFPKTAGKDQPTCTAPTGLTATYGQTLSEITLTNPAGNTDGTWSWADGAQNVGNVGSNTFKATFTPTDDANYATVSNIDVSVTVSPKNIGNVTVAAISDQEYTGSQLTPAVTVTGDDGKLTANDYTLEYGTNINKGTGTVTVKAKSGGNYTFTDVTANFNIVGKATTISISGSLDTAYGTAIDTQKVTVTKTEGSTGAVTYKYYIDEACTQGETETAPTDAGTYWIKAFLAADENFGASSSNGLKFTISQKDLTVTAKAKTIAYGDAPANDGVEYEGFVNGDNAGSLSGTLDYDYTYTQYGNVGSYDITPKGLTSDNYAISFKSGALTVEQKEVGLSWQNHTGRTFGDGKTVAAEATGTVNSDTVKVTVSGGAETAVGGPYTAEATSLTGAKAANYKLPATVTQTYSIDKGTHADGTASVVVKYSDTAEQTVDLSKFIPGDCGEISEIAVAETTDGSNIIAASSGDAAAKTAKFTLESELAAGGATATLTATVKTANYDDFTVVITVNTTDKDIPTVTAEDITVTYSGEAVSDAQIKGTASVDGSWSFKEGQSMTAAADSGAKTVVFTPADDSAYETVETTITVTIKKAVPTGKPGYTAINAAGKTLADAALTVGTITPSNGAISWDLGADQAVTANTAYGWTYVPADAANYEDLKGTITPYVTSSGNGGSHGGSGGGGGGGSTTTDTKTDIEKDLSSSGTATIGSADLAKAKSLKLENKEIAIQLDQRAITAVGTTSSLEIKAVKAGADAAKALKEDSAALIGGRPVFEITAKYGGKTVTDFGKGTIQISIVYTPAEGEKTAGLGLYYLNGEKAERVSGSYYDEKTKAVVGETDHLSLYAVGYDETQAMNVFADVKADDWFRTAVYDLYNKNILSGKTKTTFAPQDNVTRAEFATILAKAAGADLTGEAKQVFGDVAADAWYAGAAAWANEAGVASGTGNGNFSPEANITRQDMAVMLTKYISSVAKKELEVKNEAVTFTDSASIAEYAEEAVKTMQTGGIISGVKAADGSYSFKPTANATRAEAASMVSGLLNALQ